MGFYWLIYKCLVSPPFFFVPGGLTMFLRIWIDTLYFWYLKANAKLNNKVFEGKN